MTDIETMLGMLDRAKIEFTKELITQRWRDLVPGYTTIEVRGGYAGFVSLLIFSKAGALVSIEAYE
jgi:hypothetical protein